MHTTNLRKVGGSIMLAVPPALLNLLRLKVGATVAVEVENGRLIVEPQQRPRYTLEELLAPSDYSQPQPPEEREWVDAPAVGRELYETGTSTLCRSIPPSVTNSGAIVPSSSSRPPRSIRPPDCRLSCPLPAAENSPAASVLLSLSPAFEPTASCDATSPAFSISKPATAEKSTPCPQNFSMKCWPRPSPCFSKTETCLPIGL